MDQPSNPLSDLCAVSAREMHQLHTQIQGLEDAVLTILDRGPAMSSKDHYALQDFDLVAQTLAGLAGFFQHLQQQVETNGDGDLGLASDAVTLQKLRDRLRDTSSPITA